MKQATLPTAPPMIALFDQHEPIKTDTKLHLPRTPKSKKRAELKLS